MNGIVIACFVVIFALLLASIGVGLKFYEVRRRTKLVSMLRTVTENGHERHVDLLIEETNQKEVDKGTIIDRLREQLRNLLNDSGLGWTEPKFGILTGVTFFIGMLLGMRIGAQFATPALRALLGGLIMGFLPYMYVSKKKATRLDELETQLPDALDFLSRSMRAGHAFSISLEMVGEEIHEPLGQEFRALFNEQNLGASMERAFSNFGKRVPVPDVRFFSSAVLLQRQTGGNLSEILNRLSHIIRERFRLKGQVKAVSAHGRLTATILTLLPLATLGGLILTSPGYLDPLTQSDVGRKILAGGVFAQVIGNFFIRKIIKIKV
jgi:tight adherence protein B